MSEQTGPPPEPPRHRLPDTRESITRHVEVWWYERDENGIPGERMRSDLYLTAGFYEDGKLAEVFARVDKTGGMVAVLLDGCCTAVSIGLQYGIPPEVFISKWKGVGAGDPSGGDFGTTDPDVKQCRGPLDYIARRLEIWTGNGGSDSGRSRAPSE